MPGIAAQLDDPVILRALAQGRRLLELEGKKPRKLLRKTGEDDNGDPLYELVANPTWQEIDYVQRGLRHKAQGLRINQPDESRLWGNRRHQFLEEVDEANKPFARARRIWAGEEAVKEAADRGKNLFKARDKDWDADDLTVEFERFTPSEKQGFMAGVVKALRTSVNASITSVR